MQEELVKVACSHSDVCNNSAGCSWITSGQPAKTWHELRKRLGKSDGTVVGSCSTHRITMTPVEQGSCVSIWDN